MGTVWRVLTRKKILDPVSTEQTQLQRVLNTFDLTALGVGSTLGVGVYVLAGHVAKDIAGPAVVLSFLIATVASVFAGLCYAEFGARAPRAGSAYIYSYVCVGEFIAFIIGWNLILEYVIGSASVARGLSLYLDTLINNTLQNTFREIAPINLSFMSDYFDFFSFGISILLAVALAFGLKESSIVNNIFTILNLLVVIFVVIAGSIKANGENWNLPKPNNSTIHGGNGGFFPFGVEGMIKGAATCFYGFVGFDCIATTGEEVRNPKRAIPISIIVSLFIIFLSYFGTSTVVTLMVPYYEQDANAPIPHAFHVVGWEECKWVVAIGGIFGLCASLFGAMFPLPRIIYAMASDGIIFKFLGLISQRFKTPVIGTLLAGLLTGLMSALFDLKQLVNMMSIGTLLAYTIVAASVLLLRYEFDRNQVVHASINQEASTPPESDDRYTDDRYIDESPNRNDQELTINTDSSSYIKQIFHINRNNTPTIISQNIVAILIWVYCLLCISIGLCAIYLKDQIARAETWAVVLISIFIAVAVLALMIIAAQPKSSQDLTFKVPFVPLIPALSILINIYLMLMLDENTWIRFAVWMAVGLPIYYFSVKRCSDARNQSVSSKVLLSNGKTNGHLNSTFIDDETEMKPKKNQAPSPPSHIDKSESVIAVLDEILENEEAAILDNRKFSSESVTGVSRETNVKADVHRPNAPLTPLLVLNQTSLVQSSSAVPYPVESPKFIKDQSDDSPSAEIETKDSQNCQENEKTALDTLEDPGRHSLDKNDSTIDLVITTAENSEKNNSVIDEPNTLVSESIVDTLKTPEIDDLRKCESTIDLVKSPGIIIEGSKTLENECLDKDESTLDTVTSTAGSNDLAKDKLVTDKGNTNNFTKEENSESNYFKGNSKIETQNHQSKEEKADSQIGNMQTDQDKKAMASNFTEGIDKSTNAKNFIPAPPPFLSPLIDDRPVINPVKKSNPTRPHFLASDFRNVKLRKVHHNMDEIPATDYLKGDDNLKFGSEEYKSFREKLNVTLQENRPATPNIPLNKIEKNDDVSVAIKSDNVIDDHIDLNDAKNKLAQFIEDNSDYTPGAVKKSEIAENVNHTSGDKVPKEVNEDKLMKEHKKNMENVFGSIRLRKNDSISKEDDLAKETVKDIDNKSSIILNRNDDATRHRQNMDVIFRSIRQRKVDSFKE